MLSHSDLHSPRMSHAVFDLCPIIPWHHGAGPVFPLGERQFFHRIVKMPAAIASDGDGGPRPPAHLRPYSAILTGREGPASGRSSMVIMQSAAKPISAAAAPNT